MQAVTLKAALIAHAPAPIPFADCAGVIRLWNSGAERLFGYDAAEAVGRTLDFIVPEPMRAAHWEGFFRAVRHGRFTTEKVSLTVQAKDGGSIAELSAVIIFGPGGEAQGVAAIGRDVTECRAREKAQQERIASLERQVAALTEASAPAGEGANVPDGCGNR